jgi:hypothetical protein
MTTNIWLDSKASIVLLPSGEQGENLLRLAENWAEVGLLGPALWVKPEGVVRQENGPPTIAATVIGVLPDRSLLTIEVDLFEQLARENLNIIRLVKVRSAAPSRDSDALQDEVVTLIDTYVQYAMPAPDRSMSEINSQQRLDSLTLLCCTTEYSAKERLSHEQRGAGATILASPEDRSTPWSTDAFVRDGDRFLGFVLMHIATAAGLWNGIPVGTLELLESATPVGQGIWVSRVFFSGVLTDGLARRVAAEVIRDAANPVRALESPPVGTAFIEDVVRDEYVNLLVTKILDADNAMLRYRRQEKPPLPSQRNRGILEQLAAFLAFAGHKFIQIPKWTWRWIMGRLSARVQETFNGEDGLFVINKQFQHENFDHIDFAMIDQRAEIFHLSGQSKVDVSAPVALGQTRSTPDLWRRIRELIFSSLDGGAGRQANDFPIIDGDRRPIFRTVNEILTHPQAEWSFSVKSDLPQGLPATFSWKNLDEALDADHALLSWLADARSKSATTNEALYAAKVAVEKLRAELSELDDQLRDNGGMTSDDDGVERPITLAEALGKPTIAAMASAKTPIHVAPESFVPVTEEVTMESSTSEADEVDEVAEVAEGAILAAEGAVPAVEGAVLVGDAADREVNAVVTALDNDVEELPVTEIIDLPGILRLRRATAKNIGVAEKRLSEVQTRADADSVLVKTRTELGEEFEAWHHEIERSLVWRLRKFMKNERRSATADVESLEAEVQNLVIPELGALMTARKKFHRSLLIAVPITLLIAGLLIALAATRMVRSWVSQNGLNPDAIPVLVLAAALVAIIVIFFSFATVYHREWSRCERAMELQFVNLTSLSGRYVNARREASRLSYLHPQANDWLELLALALHKPWAARPAWLESSLKALDTGAQPFAMHVAQANDNDQTSRAILRTRADKSIGEIGWRERAFERMIEEVRRVTGRTQDAFNLSTLDADLPHASNGARALLRSHFADTAVLENVALSYLRPAITELQTNAMANARPTVLQVETNPLDPLRSDIEGLETNLREELWDDFLTTTLTRGEGKIDTSTPISALVLSGSGVISSIHEKVKSFALLPGHVLEILPARTVESIHTFPYEARSVRPLDAVSRVDMIGPLSEDDVRIWQGSIERPLHQRKEVVTTFSDDYDTI